MKYTNETWRERSISRMDMCESVVHLTKSAKWKNRELSPLDMILKILRERKILGSSTSSGFIVGERKAVCFQAVPLYSICENIDFEKYLQKESKKENEVVKVRYEPYGIMFDKPHIYIKGGRPVFYEKTEDAKKILPRGEYWRIVHFDLSDHNNIIYWSHEREWRLPGDLEFEVEQATIIVPNYREYKRFFELSKIDGEDVAFNARCVVPLGSSYV